MTDSPPVQGLAPPVAAGPPFDPSQNVLNLVEAGLKRQDDLREQEAAHAREMRETARRYEDRLDRKDEQIRDGESARIDAIREVDTQQVRRAAEVAAIQAATLATQVATSAETLRGQVAAAATAAATALSAALAPIQAAIEDLRRAQYETQGQKSQVVETRDTTAEARADMRARAMQSRATVSIIVASLAGLVAMLAFIAYVTKK